MFMKKCKYIALILSAIMLMVLIPVRPAYAADTAYISVGSSSGEVGSEISISVTISSSADISATRILLSYDTSIVEYVSGGDNGGGGSVQWVDTDTFKSKSRTITFKVKKAGSCKISVYGDTKIASDEGEYMTISSSSGTITGEAPVTYSTDNNLASLEISPGVLSPSFSPSVTTYTTSVDKDCTKLIVSAVANDSNATVTVTGTAMDPGSNTTQITVTAQNGSKKVYTIYTTRETGEQETESSAPQDTVSEPTVKVDGTEYKILSSFEEHPLPSGYEQEVYDYNGAKVLSGKGINTKLVIMYLENTDGKGKSGFYVYDSVKKTFSRYIEVSQPEITYAILPIDSKTMELPSGYTLTDFTLAGKQIQAMVDSDRTYALFYGISSTGETGWFRYKISDGTIQSYSELQVIPVTPTAENNEDSEKSDNNRLYIICGAVMGAVILILIVVVCVLASKLSRCKKAFSEATHRKYVDYDDDDLNYVSEEDTDDEDIEEIEDDPENVELVDSEDTHIEELKIEEIDLEEID